MQHLQSVIQKNLTLVAALVFSVLVSSMAFVPTQVSAFEDGDVGMIADPAGLATQAVGSPNTGLR
jgi:hypothetical protein